MKKQETWNFNQRKPGFLTAASMKHMDQRRQIENETEVLFLPDKSRFDMLNNPTKYPLNISNG